MDRGIPWLLGALSLGVLTACGSGSPPESSRRAYSPHDVQLICKGTDAECSGNVGLLFFVRPTVEATATGLSMYRCTAFLADSDVILTNNHCLPEEWLQGLNSTARPEVYFRIPNGFGEPLFRVISLVRTDSRVPDRPGRDFAYLRLERAVPALPLPLERLGIPSGERLSLLAIKPSGTHESFRSLNYELERIDGCQVVEAPVMHPFPHDLKLESVSLSTCPTRPGYSGAPLIDSTGRVRALLQARFSGDKVIDRLMDFRPELMAFDTPFQRFMALATNTACIPMPKENTDPMGSCVAVDRPDPWLLAYPQSAGYLSDSDRVRLQRTLALRMAARDRGFHWSFHTLDPRGRDGERTLVVRPKCFEDESLGLQDAFRVERPYFHVRQRLNESFQLRTDRLREFIGAYEFSFRRNLHDKLVGESVGVDWKITYQDLTTERGTWNVPRCHGIAEAVTYEPPLLPSAPDAAAWEALITSSRERLLGLQDNLLQVIHH